MNEELKKIIKKFSGNVVAIGLDYELTEELEENMNIFDLDTINLTKKKGVVSSKTKDKIIEHDEKYKIKRLKSKKINIKKLRRLYKKKKVDYLITNYEVIKKYMRYFIKDSVYINNNKLYLYGRSNKEIKAVLKKYKRYNVLIKPIEKKEYFIIEIDNTNSKNNKIKDIFYFIYDTFEVITDFIGDFLIN